MSNDQIQKTIAERAKSRDMSAYAIAKSIGDKGPTKETVKRFLDGRCALNSRYVSMICVVLDLELGPVADD